MMGVACRVEDRPTPEWFHAHTIHGSITGELCSGGCFLGAAAVRLTSAKLSKCLLSMDLCFGIVPQERVSQGPLQQTGKC